MNVLMDFPDRIIEQLKAEGLKRNSISRRATVNAIIEEYFKAQSEAGPEPETTPAPAEDYLTWPREEGRPLRMCASCMASNHCMGKYKQLDLCPTGRKVIVIRHCRCSKCEKYIAEDKAAGLIEDTEVGSL